LAIRKNKGNSDAFDSSFLIQLPKSRQSYITIKKTIQKIEVKLPKKKLAEIFKSQTIKRFSLKSGQEWPVSKWKSR